MELSGSPMFPGNPHDHSPCSSTPAGPSTRYGTKGQRTRHGPRTKAQRGLPTVANFGAQSHGFWSRCLRLEVEVTRHRARLASGCWSQLCRTGFDPQGFYELTFRTSALDYPRISFGAKLRGAVRYRRSSVLKLRFFRRVWAQKEGGFLLSADLGKIVVRKRTIRQPLKKEPPMLIMQDALPLFKSFLKPVSLKQRARQLVLRCVIAFLMHLGKMSASRVAGAVRTDARHRAQVSRFLGRRYWRRCDLLGQLRAQLLEMEARQGTFVFDIDQTYCSQQGKLTENTIIRGEKTNAPRRTRRSRRSTRSGRRTVS